MQHGGKARRANLDIERLEAVQQRLDVTKTLRPFHIELGIDLKDVRAAQRHGVEGEARLTHLRGALQHGLRAVARRLAQPGAHCPQRRLSGTARDLRILIQDLRRFADEQVKINVGMRGSQHVMAGSRLRANRVRQRIQGVDVDAPAFRAPGQRQRPFSGNIGVNRAAAAVQLFQAFSQTVDALSFGQFERCRPACARIIGVYAKGRQGGISAGSQHALITPVQGQAQRLGPQLQDHVSLGQPHTRLSRR